MSKKIIILVGLVSLVCVPTIALAQGTTGFDDPLKNAQLEDIITRVIYFLLGLVGLFALLALIVGGIRMIIAFGNDERVANAKKMIFWAIAGLTVVVLSWAIINIVARQFLGAQ